MCSCHDIAEKLALNKNHSLTLSDHLVAWHLTDNIYIFIQVSKNPNQMPNVHFVLKRTKSIVVSIDFRGVFFHVHAMLQIQILLLLFIFHKHFFLPSLGIRPSVRPSVVRRKLSHLNLLWNRWTKLNLTWQGWSLVGSFQNCVRQLCPPFKMAAVKFLWNFSFSRFLPIIQIGHIW